MTPNMRGYAWKIDLDHQKVEIIVVDLNQDLGKLVLPSSCRPKNTDVERGSLFERLEKKKQCKKAYFI